MQAIAFVASGWVRYIRRLQKHLSPSSLPVGFHIFPCNHMRLRRRMVSYQESRQDQDCIPRRKNQKHGSINWDKMKLKNKIKHVEMIKTKPWQSTFDIGRCELFQMVSYPLSPYIPRLHPWEKEPKTWRNKLIGYEIIANKIKHVENNIKPNEKAVNAIDIGRYSALSKWCPTGKVNKTKIASLKRRKNKKINGRY